MVQLLRISLFQIILEKNYRIHSLEQHPISNTFVFGSQANSEVGNGGQPPEAKALGSVSNPGEAFLLFKSLPSMRASQSICRGAGVEINANMSAA